MSYLHFIRSQCAITEESKVICWGSARGGGVRDAPQDQRYKAVSVGYHQACAIRKSSETMDCWGMGIQNPRRKHPLGNKKVQDVVMQVSPCQCSILRGDETLKCWGGDPNVCRRVAALYEPKGCKYQDDPNPGREVCGGGLDPKTRIKQVSFYWSEGVPTLCVVTEDHVLRCSGRDKGYQDSQMPEHRRILSHWILSSRTMKKGPFNCLTKDPIVTDPASTKNNFGQSCYGR